MPVRRCRHCRTLADGAFILVAAIAIAAGCAPDPFATGREGGAQSSVTTAGDAAALDNAALMDDASDTGGAAAADDTAHGDAAADEMAPTDDAGTGVSAPALPSVQRPPQVETASSLAAYTAPTVYVAGDDRPRGIRSATEGWATDWRVHSVSYRDLLSGGVARDQIPALDAPLTESVAQADDWLDDREPVIAVFTGGASRAYPLQVLTWHEIANDRLGDVPIAVTYCPLCNAALVFDRRVHSEEVSFGVSGLLRNSDLIMYDRQTESLWQQLEGEAIAGALTGTRLTLLPSLLVSWADFKSTFPEGDVLSRQTGRARSYGVNPYVGYDTTNEPFLLRGQADARLPAVERVVAVELGSDVVAYPFSVLADQRVANDQIGEIPVAVFWKPGTASALDTEQVAHGRDVGAAGVFDRRTDRLTGAPTAVEATVLTFTPAADGNFQDDQTGSTWSVTGHAIDGPLVGAEMALVPHGSHFWFAWAAFRPDTRVWE